MIKGKKPSRSLHRGRVDLKGFLTRPLRLLLNLEGLKMQTLPE
jgi:hypothetical protein